MSLIRLLILCVLPMFNFCESAEAYFFKIECIRQEELEKEYLRGTFEILEISEPIIKCEFGNDGKRLEPPMTAKGVGCLVKVKKKKIHKGNPDKILYSTDFYGFGAVCSFRPGKILNLTLGKRCCYNKWPANLCGNELAKDEEAWDPTSPSDMDCSVGNFSLIEPKSLAIPKSEPQKADPK